MTNPAIERHIFVTLAGVWRLIAVGSLASKPWKAKAAPPKTKATGPLCFDELLQLVDCKVL